MFPFRWVALGWSFVRAVVAEMLPFCRESFPRFSQSSQSVGAHRFAAPKPVGFSLIHLIEANVDVADGVCTRIVKAGHAVFAAMYAALREFAALKPDAPPLVKGKKELDFPAPGAVPVAVKGIALWVLALSSMALARGLFCLFRIGCTLHPFSVGDLLAIFRIPLAYIRADFLAVRCMPSLHAGSVLFSAIFGFSHWFHSSGTMVRGGISAETPVLSRLYHAWSS